MTETNPATPATDGEPGLWDRTTAPQSPFTTRQALLGSLIFLLGLLLTVVLPILAT